MSVAQAAQDAAPVQGKEDTAEGNGDSAQSAIFSVLVSRCLELVAVEESDAGVHDVSSNPYVQVSLPGLPKLKSRTVQRSLDPVFDEQFDIDVSSFSEHELKQMKLKVVVRHQADLAQKRTTSDAYLGRADIAVAELLARRDEEAAAAGDEVSAADDTWVLSDPGFKVKSKHLRMRMARMATQDVGSPRSPLRHRHPYGTVQLRAEYLTAGHAQENKDLRQQLRERPSTTAAMAATDSPSSETRAVESEQTDQSSPDLFDTLAAGMLRELGVPAARTERESSNEPASDSNDWSGKAMLDAILAGVHKTPIDAPTSPLIQLGHVATPEATRMPDPDSIYTPSARPQYSPQLPVTITPIAPSPISPSHHLMALSPVTAMTPAAKEAKELAQEIIGDLETTEMSTVARSARTLAAEILAERGAELENSYVENQAIRTDAMAAVDLERSAREHAESLVRESLESTERAEAHIEAMEQEANERLRKHQAHAAALQQQYESRLEDHRRQNQLHVESLEASFKMETTAAKDEAVKYHREMMESEKEHADEIALQKAAHQKLVHTERVYGRWVSLVHKIAKGSLELSVEAAKQRHREVSEKAARVQLGYNRDVNELTEQMRLLKEAAEEERQQHEEVQRQVAEDRQAQAARLNMASEIAVAEAKERCLELASKHRERVDAHEKRIMELESEHMDRVAEHMLSHDKTRSELEDATRRLEDAKRQEHAQSREVETVRSELSTVMTENEQLQAATENELSQLQKDLKKQQKDAQQRLVGFREEQQQAEVTAALEQQEAAARAAAQREREDEEQRQRDAELAALTIRLQVVQTEKEALESEMGRLKKVEADFDAAKAELEDLRATKTAPVTGPLDLRMAMSQSQQADLPSQQFSSVDSLDQHETDLEQSSAQVELEKEVLEKLWKELADTKRDIEDQRKKAEAYIKEEQQHREIVLDKQISGVKVGARKAIEEQADMLLEQLEKAEKEWIRETYPVVLTFAEPEDLGLRWIKGMDNTALLHKIVPGSQAASHEKRLNQVREVTESSQFVVAAVDSTEVEGLSFAEVVSLVSTEHRPVQIKLKPCNLRPAACSSMTTEVDIVASLPEEGSMGTTYKRDQSTGHTFVASVNSPGDISGEWHAMANIMQEGSDSSSVEELCFELWQHNTLVCGRSLGSDDMLGSHFTLVGTIAEQTLSMTQCFYDGRCTEWTAQVCQMGSETVMTKGSWRGSHQFGFTARRTSNTVERLNIGTFNTLEPHTGLSVSILSARGTQQPAAVNDWSGVRCTLKLIASEESQPPMQRELRQIGSSGGVSPVLCEQFHDQRHGMFTPEILELLFEPADEGQGDEGQSASIAGSCAFSLASLQTLGSSHYDFTGWFPLVRPEEAELKQATVAGTVLAQLSWRASGSVMQPISTALQQVIVDTDCQVVALKECTDPAHNNKFALERRTVGTFYVRSGQRIEWQARALSTLTESPASQKASVQNGRFRCFSPRRTENSVPDVADTILDASVDFILWFCPEGAATGRRVALDGKDHGTGVKRVCTHTGTFDASENGQLAFIIDDAFKIDPSELRPTPSAEEGVPPSVQEPEVELEPEPEPEAEAEAESKTEVKPEVEVEADAASAAGIWIADGVIADGKTKVQECFVLWQTGCDAHGNAVYEGGSIDGVTLPGHETLNDDGGFSLVNCVVVEGKLTFRQQFHDGRNATMWEATVSTGGSELHDGRWTDAGNPAATANFQAKRVRTAAVAGVEMVIGVKEYGAKDEVKAAVAIGATEPGAEDEVKAEVAIDDTEPGTEEEAKVEQAIDNEPGVPGTAEQRTSQDIDAAGGPKPRSRFGLCVARRS